MAKEKFILVSLEDDKAKKLAEVISNNTCRKILDKLSEKEYTETELSEHLKIPISTIHYNLKHLLQAKLVETTEFHYSKKGKEVQHYTLSNQYVIIAPKNIKEGLRERLEKIIPSAVLTLGIGWIAQLLYKMRFNQELSTVQTMADDIGMMSRDAMPEMMALGAEVVPESNILVSDINVFVWILFGAIIFGASYLFIDYLIKKIKK